MAAVTVQPKFSRDLAFVTSIMATRTGIRSSRLREPNEVLKSFNQSGVRPASRVAGRGTLRALAAGAATFAALAVGGLAFDGATHGARAQGAYSEPAGEVDLDTFYRELAPYGEWFTHPRWGTVWRPSVDEDWRPYTRGYWANTDEQGWVWVAEEEWGWAPFHYGRWAFDDAGGDWLWIPGTEWAPAWVMWRQSDDLVGWAPLPPDAIWDPGYGLRFNATSYEGPRYYSYWSFVRPEHMFVPSLHRYLVPREQYRSFFGRTAWVRDHHRFVDGRVYHSGIDRRWVEQRAGRSLPLVTLRSVRTPHDAWTRGRVGSEVPVFRPRVTAVPGRSQPDWVRRDAPTRRVEVPERDVPRRGPDVMRHRDGSVTVAPGPMAPPPGRVERRVPQPDRVERPIERPVVQPRVMPQPPPEPRRDVRREVGPQERLQAPPQGRGPAPTPERRPQAPREYEPRG